MDTIRLLMRLLLVGETDTSGKWNLSAETVVGAIRTGVLIFAATALVEGVEALLQGVDAIEFGLADQAVSSLIAAAADFFRRWYKNYAPIADHYRPVNPNLRGLDQPPR